MSKDQKQNEDVHLEIESRLRLKNRISDRMIKLDKKRQKEDRELQRENGEIIKNITEDKSRAEWSRSCCRRRWCCCRSRLCWCCCCLCCCE